MSAQAPAVEVNQKQHSSVVRMAYIAAVVLGVDFFILPWMTWESRAPNAVAWAVNNISAVTLAIKAELYGLWLIPICAVVVLLSNFASLDQVKKSTVMIGASIVSGIVILYFVGMMSGSEGREKLAFLGQPITSSQLSGAIVIPIACACVILYAGVRLRRMHC